MSQFLSKKQVVRTKKKKEDLLSEKVGKIDWQRRSLLKPAAEKKEVLYIGIAYMIDQRSPTMQSCKEEYTKLCIGLHSLPLQMYIDIDIEFNFGKS